MTFGTPQRIEIKYDAAKVQSMLDLLKASPFPDKAPIDANTPWKLGIEYEYLKKLRTMFLTEWSAESLENNLGRFNNYLVHYGHEGDSLDLHYIHVKSPRSDAIPLILLHGWPGSVYDFHKVIEPLTNPGNPELPAFHVVVPSLPGFFQSTLPRRDGWSLADNARLFDGLMTSVLGYRKYVAQGGDWGAMILQIMSSMFPDSVSLSHFNMFIAVPPADIDPSKYSELEKRALSRSLEFRESGSGYYLIQNTKPFTIGIAVASSPLAILAYIGEKIYGWSDPSLVSPQDILNTVALYYLSGSFATSVVIYNQAGKEMAIMRTPKAGGKYLLKNKFGYSVFPYELASAPKTVLSEYGPLVYHREHARGGHFPALDVPADFVGDLREFFGEHWSSA